MMLDDYNMGTFPMSIGTSLAFEGLLGIHPERPNLPDRSKEFQTLWINLETLARNAISAYSMKKPKDITLNQLVDHMSQDTEMIDRVLHDRGIKLKVFYYTTKQMGFKTKFPDFNLYVPTSDNTIAHMKLVKEASAILVKKLNSTFEMNEFNVRVVDKTLVMTHYGWDLMTQSTRNGIALIESHTGVIKPPELWYTKLNSSNAKLPFYRCFMGIVGDRHYIAPNAVLKKKILRISREQRWHNMTAFSKILADLRMLKEDRVLEFVIKYR